MELTVRPDGFMTCAGRDFACRLGRSGVIVDKREGDGATPAGIWPMRRVLYRADRLAAPVTGLPVSAIAEHDGWCDAPEHPDYNQAVSLPHPASCENLHRDDHLYDVLAVLGHNDDPPVPGLGSAIFLHVAPPAGKPTQGCVALDLADLLFVLSKCRPGDVLRVIAPAE